VPLARIDAPPAVDRTLAAPPTSEVPQEVSRAAAEPLLHIEAAPTIDRALASLPKPEVTGELAASVDAPLRRLEEPPSVDRSLAPQGEIAMPRAAPGTGAAGRAASDAPPRGERIFAPRIDDLMSREAPPSDGGPRLDLEATRRLARDINREPPPGSRDRPLILATPPPEGESRLARAIANAAQPDCRTAYAGLGLLALPVLLIDAITDKGCRW
jgi:hypothetical protein